MLSETQRCSSLEGEVRDDQREVLGHHSPLEAVLFPGLPCCQAAYGGRNISAGKQMTDTLQ